MNADRSEIEAIKERIDIVSLISRYLTLTKSGSRYKGHCPFHKDDTPSFYVDPEKGLWHCFGCGAGGDLFGFLMKIERISFKEALERLAAEAGVRIARRGDGTREKLYAISAEVGEYFAGNLHHPKIGKRAREYLEARGYDPKTWDRFGLGYAPDEWEALKRRFSKRYGMKPLLALGLLVKGKNERLYDRFRDRVIFPIYDLNGRLIAFGGRAFSGEPKYLNSPKTPLFDKSRTLYGLSWAREEIATRKLAVLVEGYTDVLSLHAVGIANAIGSMGTSLTQGQADLLARFADEVIIAYDRDSAGGAASVRGMQILRNAGLSVRVARLPEGEDPDSFVRRGGKGAFLEVIEEAIPFHLFFLDTLKERYELATLRGKEEALSAAQPFYQGLSSLPLRQEVAQRLGELLGLPAEEVARELSRRLRRPSPAPEEAEAMAWGKEEVIIALLLRGEARWEEVSRLAGPGDFSPRYQPLVEAIAEAGDPVEPAALIPRLDDDSVSMVSEFALAPVVFSDAKKALNDALVRLVRLPEIEKRLAELREGIRKAEEAKDKEKIDALERTYKALVAEKIARRRDAEGRRTTRK